MKALLLVAHGSRKEGANAALTELATHVEALGGQSVRCAFLQFGEPDLSTALAEMATECQEITVVPLVLTAGKHLEEDIAAMLAGLRATCPNLTVTLSSHLGAWSGLPQAILDLARQR